MVKTVLGSNYRGLREFVLQRLSAVIMAVYSVAMIFYFILHPHFDYFDWRNLFNAQWVKVASVLFLASLLIHTWIGIWTVITDYIKSPVLRFFLQTFVFLSLLVSLIWGLQILWGL